MATGAPAHVHEARSGVWVLAAAPAVWALHFVASYVLAAVWCARAGRDAALGGAAVAVLLVTVLALGVLAWLGWRGWRRLHLRGGGELAGDSSGDSARQREHFLGKLALLLAALAAVAVLYAASVVAFVGTCA